MINKEYRYQLETRKLTGRRQKKFTCPHCGKPKCFVRYVDTKNGFCYVADSVGKCDHQHACGYHYKPAAYYHDNQWATQPEVHTESHSAPEPLPPFQPIPMAYVLRSQSPQSTFWNWVATSVADKLHLTDAQLRQVFQDYHIGATRLGRVIFWQIDQWQQVHGGHIMQYRCNGHRDGYQGWAHVPLIRVGILPPRWTLYQCLFGEHLLRSRPADHVCLVESEKTAIIMAAYKPEHVWLATCGSGGLSPEKVRCLAGRRVTLFPDSGCYGKWSEQMRLATGIDYNVSDSLESYPPNTDLCDLLL